MKITWSIPVFGERIGSSRGDLVRAKHLIEGLHRLGHDVRVVTYADQSSANLVVAGYRRVIRRFLPRPVALALRDVGRMIEGRRHGRRVARESLSQGAELIVETQVGFVGSGGLAARITGLPLVLDDCSPSSEEVVLGAGLPSVARWVLKRQAQAASKIVAVSKEAHKMLVEEGVPCAKLSIVPNGVDAKAYQDLDREATRKRLGIADGCVIGFVGSFQPWHSVELLVNAFAKLPTTYPAYLVLVGDGPTRRSALEAGHRLGLNSRVKALGEVIPDKVPELIVSFDIGVLPGHNSYSHPMKLLEYAAAGLPMVAPDLPPVREVLEDGATGLLFRQGDLDGLVAQLTRLVNNTVLRERLGDQAREKLMKGTSWEDRASMLVAQPPGWQEEEKLVANFHEVNP